MKVTLCFLLTLLGCTSDIPIPSDVKSEVNSDTAKYWNQFRVKWRFELHSNEFCRSGFTSNDLACFVLGSLTDARNDRLLVVNMLSGEELWQIQVNGASSFLCANQKIWYIDNQRVITRNVRTGHIVSQTVIPHSSSRPVLHKSKLGPTILLSTQDIHQDSDSNEGHIHMFKDNKFDLIASLSAHELDSYTPDFQTIDIIKDNSDTLLLITSRSWNWGETNRGKGHVLVYSLQNDRVIKDFTHSLEYIDVGVGTLSDKKWHITNGWDHFAAIDLVSMELVMQSKTLSENSSAFHHPLLCANQRIYAHSGNRGVLRVIDAKTGRLLKVVKDLGSDWYSAPFVCFDGRVMSATGSFLISIDTLNLTHDVLKEDDPLDGFIGSFSGGLLSPPGDSMLIMTRGNNVVGYTRTQKKGPS